MTVDVGLREPPQVSGGEGEHGHLDELRVDPIALMARVRAECGDVGQFRLADRARRRVCSARSRSPVPAKSCQRASVSPRSSEPFLVASSTSASAAV